MSALGSELAREIIAAIRDDAGLRDEIRALLAVEGDVPVRSGSPWLSIDDAAAYLNVSARTLERRISAGRVRSTTVGRRRLFHRDDLDALAATGEDVAPTTPPRRRAE